LPFFSPAKILTRRRDNEILSRMTLAAVRKMASRLTPAQKRRLGRELLAEGAPQLPPNATMEDIRRRREEILSGKVKPVTWAESEARLDRLAASRKRFQGLRPTQ
jgi:hypothetical protein